MTETFLNGPNQVLPATSYHCVEPNGKVKLLVNPNDKNPPISVPGLLQKTVRNYPDTIALCSKKNGEWNKMRYKDYEEQVRICARAFLKLGLERYHSVCILGFNSPEWHISDIAAIYAGGFAAGIYTTNSAEACFHCLDHSRANIVVLEDEIQLEKILLIQERLPNLKAIIQYSGQCTHPKVISWSNLLDIGKRESSKSLERILKTLAINEGATLVFTSGTTGNPKAVMLSHDNLIWDAAGLIDIFDLKYGCESIVSYLPLSHVAAQVVDIYCTMTIAATVYFADKDALKGSLIDSLKEVQPTRFIAVPRVWEKIYEKMKQVAAETGYIKTAISTTAKAYALEYYMDKINGKNSDSWGFMVSKLIFHKVHAALGLNKCKMFVSAAAPLSPEIKKYFLSVNIPIMEAFGMSEDAGAHTCCTLESFGLDTIGRNLPGTQTKIVNCDANGHGEICIYGRHVFMGYLLDSKTTNDTVDKDNWLHSGDIGYIDDKGLVYITGRLKELLITAGGENVAPIAIEQALKSAIPQISNCMLVGDQRKFLSILITLKTEIDKDTSMPLDDLTRETSMWLDGLGCGATTVSQVLKAGPHINLVNFIQEKINQINVKAISRAQNIQKFVILPRDFSIPTGEFGPTLKLKRKIVLENNKQIIDEIYK